MGSGVTRFGQIEFDEARGELRVAGRSASLDVPCAAILAILIGEAGRIVDKDRLLEAGWPGRVVHENSLAKAIGRLRKALGEDGQALQTVHGYGYRLDAEPTEAASFVANGPVRSGLSRRAALAATALGIAALGGLTLAALLRETPGAERQVLLRGEPADAIGRVLWVDDHPQNNLREKEHFENRKIAVYQVATSEEALALLAMYEYRAVISDMNRHGRPLAGLELVREMRGRGDATPFIVYSVVPSAAQNALVTEAGGQRAAVTPEELYAAVLPLFGEPGEPKDP